MRTRPCKPLPHKRSDRGRSCLRVQRPSEAGSSFSVPHARSGSTIAITVCTGRSCLVAAQQRLREVGAEIVVRDTDRVAVLPTCDPGGITIEIRSS
jgi:hypothetical protein